MIKNSPKLKEKLEQKRISRRKFLSYVGKGAVALGAAEFIGLQPKVSAAEVKRGGYLRFDWDWIPYVKDPCTDGVGTGQMARNVAETLIELDPLGNPQPLLCKSWEAKKGGKEWILHLQEGVTFNNGKPFNADDVVWNLLHWLDPEVGSPNRAKLSMLSPSGVEKVDNYTVKLHLDRPFYGISRSLHGYPALIAPEGGWEDFYSGDPKDAIGTGPFLMKEFVPDEKMVLVRRKDYWRDGVDGKPLPYLDSVEVKPGLTDSARLSGLVEGTLDIAMPGAAIMGKLRTYKDILTYVMDVGYSSPARVRCDLEPFNDPRVRQAMKWCQDREKIRDLVMPDGPLGWDHWVQSWHKTYCPKTDGNRPQDIDKAKKLLAEAGYPKGFKTKLYCPTTPHHRPAFAQALAEDLAKANIDVNIQKLPDSAFWDKWKEWPFSVSGWSGRPLAVDNMRLGATCGADWNEMHWCNKVFDATLDKYLATMNPDKRRQLSCKLQRIMQEDSGLLLPFWNVNYRAWRKEVQGYHPNLWNHYFTKIWKK